MINQTVISRNNIFETIVLQQSKVPRVHLKHLLFFYELAGRPGSAAFSKISCLQLYAIFVVIKKMYRCLMKLIIAHFSQYIYRPYH